MLDRLFVNVYIRYLHGIHLYTSQQLVALSLFFASPVNQVFKRNCSISFYTVAAKCGFGWNPYKVFSGIDQKWNICLFKISCTHVNKQHVQL